MGAVRSRLSSVLRASARVVIVVLGIAGILLLRTRGHDGAALLVVSGQLTVAVALWGPSAIRRLSARWPLDPPEGSTLADFRERRASYERAEDGDEPEVYRP